MINCLVPTTLWYMHLNFSLVGALESIKLHRILLRMLSMAIEEEQKTMDLLNLYNSILLDYFPLLLAFLVS